MTINKRFVAVIKKKIKIRITKVMSRFTSKDNERRTSIFNSLNNFIIMMKKECWAFMVCSDKHNRHFPR